MQSKIPVRGALCAGSLIALVSATIASGATPDGGSGDGVGASAADARYLVKRDGTVYDLMATDEWAVVVGLSQTGVIEWIGSDATGGIVCAWSAGAGSGTVVISVPRTVNGTDIDNDDAVTCGGSSASALWSRIMGTDIDNDEDTDIVIRPVGAG